MKTIKPIIFIFCLLIAASSCNNDDNNPKTKITNYVEDSEGKFKIQDGFYMGIDASIGSIGPYYIFSAEENGVRVEFEWGMERDKSNTGEFDIIKGVYKNKKEGIDNQEVKGTITIKEFKKGWVEKEPREGGKYNIYLEGKYKFETTGNTGTLTKEGIFKYDGEYSTAY